MQLDRKVIGVGAAVSNRVNDHGHAYREPPLLWQLVFLGATEDGDAADFGRSCGQRRKGCRLEPDVNSRGAGMGQRLRRRPRCVSTLFIVVIAGTVTACVSPLPSMASVVSGIPQSSLSSRPGRLQCRPGVPASGLTARCAGIHKIGLSELSAADRARRRTRPLQGLT